jgi:hypothetical protein
MYNFVRKNGVWYIANQKHMQKSNYSDFLEDIFQAGVREGNRQVFSPSRPKNIRQNLSDFHILECEKLLKECEEILGVLEKNLSEQCKPSEALRNYNIGRKL